MSSIIKRQRLACSRCTRRKVKCDKAHPKCHQCAKSGTDCVYHAAQPFLPQSRLSNDERLAQLARYEDLMRQHNIDFSAVAKSLAEPSEYVESPIENQNGHHMNNTANYAFHQTWSFGHANNADELKWCSWSSLSIELKYPPVTRLRPVDDPLVMSKQQPFSCLLASNSGTRSLHPEPRQIYKLWEIFVERVNPLIKIVHVPTLQQQIMDASWDPSKATPSLKAMLFAIYTAAIAALSTSDCVKAFGESRHDLFLRYRAATTQALVAAELMTTRDLLLLQALLIFLISDPDSDLTSTLCGLAVRLGLKMGLDRSQDDRGVSFFEREMRIRLWWGIIGLDARCRRLFTHRTKAVPPSDFGNVRLPLNVNDADLHPDMTEAPIEHDTPTEMRCVLMKYELSGRLLSSPLTANVFEAIMADRERTPKGMELADKTIDDIASVYQNKYLRHSDTSIPLHQLTHAAATLGIASWRFMSRHPRPRTPPGTTEVYMMQDEIDMLFEQALTAFESINVATHSIFPPYLVSHLYASLQIDVLVFVLSELRHRHVGDRVRLAWKLVGSLFADHPELIQDSTNSLFTALGALVLEAWDARRNSTTGIFESMGENGHASPPAFIHALRAQRAQSSQPTEQDPPLSDPTEAGTAEFDLFLNSGSWDWDFWTDFQPQ